MAVAARSIQRGSGALEELRAFAPVPLLLTESSVGAAVDAAAERQPGSWGWVFQDQRVTFENVNAKAEVG
jgi:hypothetical protein